MRNVKKVEIKWKGGKEMEAVDGGGGCGCVWLMVYESRGRKE